VRVLRLLVVAAALFYGAAAHAADAANIVIGQLTGVRGEVFREGAGRREPAALGMPLHQGDVLASYAGKARVQLNDGTIVSLGENSRLDFRDYRRADNDFTVELVATSGVFRLLVNRLIPGGFRVETETAVASVRGTEWVMQVSADATAVAVLDGSVGVAGRDGAAVLLQPGQGTDVRRGAAPTPPVTWGAARFADTVARASFD
jgi:hypothetical protein